MARRGSTIILCLLFTIGPVPLAHGQPPARQGAPSGLRRDHVVVTPPLFPSIDGSGRAAGVDVPLGGTNEQAIAVNPVSPTNIVASSLFSYRVSNDAGDTWSASIFNVVPAGYGLSGDPALAFDSQGRLFYTYLGFHFASGGLDIIVSEINPATGALIAGPVVASTSGPAGGENDKPWIAADRFAGSPFQDRVYLVWTEFPVAASERVLFAYSTDHGATWTSPVQLSSSGDGFAWPPTVAVAPNGDVYVSYHSQVAFNGIGELGGNPTGTSGRIFVLRSTDGGNTFPQKTAPFTSGQADVTFNVQSSPGTIPNTDFWLQGSGQPWVLPDPVNPGNVYVVANDDPDNVHGVGDDADVFIARSTDDGMTWSAPSRVDHGPGESFQVMPSAAIDDTSGCIVVMWYDNRLGAFNAGGNYLLDVFYAVSANGGLSFSPDVQINDSPFDPDLGAPQRLSGPPPTLRIGEYNQVAFLSGNAYFAWTGNTGGGQQAVFDLAPGICSGDCNTNGIEDGLEIALGADDCNGNLVLDVCEIDVNSTAPGGPFFCTTDCATDCNNDAVPDECQLSASDCNTNGTIDSCDIDAGTSLDCNGDGIPNECQIDGGLNLLAADFEAGIPAGWAASGLWHTTGACPRPSECNPAAWAYYGIDATCTFNTGAVNSGVMSAPLIAIPAGISSATLTYCSAYAGEGGNSNVSARDWAWVSVNGAEVDDVSFDGTGSDWAIRAVDLTAFAGQNVTLAFNFDSRSGILNNFLGWEVDDVRLDVVVIGLLDCNGNVVPDSCEIASGATPDCNANGIPDPCEAPVPCKCGTVLGDMNGDGIVDGNDLPLFIACRLIGDPMSGCPCGDLDENGVIDDTDTGLMVTCLLGLGCP